MISFGIWSSRNHAPRTVDTSTRQRLGKQQTEEISRNPSLRDMSCRRIYSPKSHVHATILHCTGSPSKNVGARDDHKSERTSGGIRGSNEGWLGRRGARRSGTPQRQAVDVGKTGPYQGCGTARETQRQRRRRTTIKTSKDVVTNTKARSKVRKGRTQKLSS